MTFKSDPKFAERLTSCLENDKYFGKFSPEHSKVPKFELWRDPFVQSRKCMGLKYTKELCVMKIKKDTEIAGELACRFTNDMRNFTNFHLSTRKSKKFFF